MTLGSRVLQDCDVMRNDLLYCFDARFFMSFEFQRRSDHFFEPLLSDVVVSFNGVSQFLGCKRSQR